MKQKNFLKIVLCFMFITNVNYGQNILTFEFSDLTGKEATAASNFNNKNITSSTISRGAGLHATQKAERFNAINWATTSIANAVTGNNYMEFTITPNASYKFSISSIEVNLQRSGTGPSAIAIRNSLDSYAANLDTEKTIVDNTDTQRFTFTFTQSNATLAVTYRIYMYAESSNTGSGGIGDFTGNDLVINGLVSLASTSPKVGFDSATSSQKERNTSFNVDIPVTVSNYDENQIDVSIAATGTAEAEDFTLNTSSLSFTANGTQNISLDINPDTDDFDDETIILTLTETSAVTGLVIYQTTHTVTVTEDETAPSIGFNTATSSQTETDTTFNVLIPITILDYSGTQIDIKITATGTAESGDYTLNTTSLSFTSNGSQNIYLDINNDADDEHETVILKITETSAATGLVISQATHTVTITDDEAPVFLVEDFTNSMARPAYGNDSFLGNNGITWTYVESKDENGDANGAGINGKALMLKKVANKSEVTSSTISGGIGDFSVKLYKGHTGAGDRQVELFINGVSKGSSIAFDDANDKDAYTFTVDDINIGGDIVLEIRNSTDYQVIVDDISWTSYAPTVTWIGTTDDNWATASNWDTNSVPTASDNVLIPDTSIFPVIQPTTGASVNNIKITDPDGIIITHGSSLIVNGTSTGKITYYRTISAEAGNLKGWYLMASPVIEQVYDDTYVTANNIAINGTNVGIATYTTSSDSWAYHQNGASATFTSGKGYSVKRASTDKVSFSGTINTDNLGIDAILTTGGNKFNLLGNPYTSYINSATFLNDESAISKTKTIWVFNQTLGTNGSYEVKTVGDAFVVAPGQGFFVKANVAGGTFNFSKANQNHNADTFQKESKTEIKLSITDGTINQYAKLYYLENATTGFDVGYEGEVFGGKTESFSLYSELVSNNQNKKYQVQSLPNTGLEAMIVPFGLKAAAGKEITFSIEANNLPSGINVYLEDRLLNTFTRLNEPNTNYKVILADAANGTGRFYLHTASKALSTATKILNSVSINKTSTTNLRIAGLQNGGASVKIFSLLGKQVVSTSFVANGVKEITLPNLATGIYIVQLQNEAGKLSKKIILE